MRRTSSDPGRALLTGFVGGPRAQDDWDKFDVPGLRGISKTAPYFHNNSAATLEEVVDHYIEFFKRVQANSPPGRRAADRDDRRRALRSAADAGRARRAAGVPAEALGSLFSEWDHRCSRRPLTVAFRLTGRAITKWRGACSATGFGRSTSRSLATTKLQNSVGVCACRAMRRRRLREPR